MAFLSNRAISLILKLIFPNRNTKQGLKLCGFVANGQVRIYHADRLGSVRWVTDGGQNILVSYVYEGFGKIVGQNGGGGGPYQFCGLWGYRNDWDAGLMHVGARYYEVETGRWVQKDPLINIMNSPRILNSYAYVINNPISNIDPNGYVTVTVIIVAVIVGFVSGFAGSVISDLVGGEPIDWGDAIGWGVGGALVAPFCVGGGTVRSVLLTGGLYMAAGFFAGCVDSAISNPKPEYRDIPWSAPVSGNPLSKYPMYVQ